MELQYINHHGMNIAVLADGMISTVQDALDLIGTASYSGASGIVLPMERLSPGFFELKTRLAGEVLQKFVNYSMRAAIVGDFSGFTSKSLADFIRESNKGRHVLFKSTVDEAISALAALDD